MDKLLEEMLHYASPYYDPVKAHEYYEAHKHLKGRRSSSKLNDEGKKVWAYTKESITSEKKTSVQAQQESRDRQIQQLRDQAKATKERISQRLKQLKEALTAKAQKQRESVRSKTISKSASVEAKARFQAQKKQKLASITEETSKTRTGYQDDAREQREKVSTELKSSIAAARESYKAAKASLDENYEDIYQDNYDRILAEYAKPVKSSGSTKKSASTSSNSNAQIKSLDEWRKSRKK